MALEFLAAKKLQKNAYKFINESIKKESKKECKTRIKISEFYK